MSNEPGEMVLTFVLFLFDLIFSYIGTGLPGLNQY